MQRVSAIMLAAALSGSIAFACTYSMMVWEPLSDADPPYFSIWGGGKEGWIDRAGRKVRFEPQLPLPDPDGMKAFLEGDHYGYRRAGEVVIPPRFLYAGEFHEGRARVVLDGPCIPAGAGICSGTIILPMSAIPSSVSRLQAMARLWTPTAPPCQYTFINERGDVAGVGKFQEAGDFHEGLAAVRTIDLWGYVDQQLSVVVEPRFSSAAAFSEGVAAVKDGQTFSYIDRTGRVIIPGPFDSAGQFHEGLAVVYTNRSAHFIDKAGQHAVPGAYPYAGRFFHGLANVQLDDGRLAYIDRKGRVVYRWKP